MSNFNSITLVGEAFNRVLIKVTNRDLDNQFVLGTMLMAELAKSGFQVHDLDSTQEMPALPAAATAVEVVQS